MWVRRGLSNVYTRGLFMKREGLSRLLAAAVVAMGSAQATAGYDSVTVLSHPLAKSSPTYATWVKGISGSMAVGYYEPVGGGTHGFTYADGIYTTIDHPGDTFTQLWGADGNTLWGYSFTPSIDTHNFTLTDGVFTDVNYPGYGGSVTGVSGNIVAGTYGSNGGLRTDGFIKIGDVYTSLTHPLATGGVAGHPYPATMVDGVSGDTVAGHYFNNGLHGFTYTVSTGAYTTFDVPFATGDVYVVGISGDNILGYVLGSGGSGSAVPFLKTGNVFTQLTDPAGMASGWYPEGISGNTIVGLGGDRFGRPITFMATLSVPEPTSLCLVAVGGLALLGRRRAR